MSRNDFDSIRYGIICVILALTWILVLVIPGVFLIDIITNNIIYRRLYVAIMCVVGLVLIAIIMVKETLIKRIDDYLTEMMTCHE